MGAGHCIDCGRRTKDKLYDRRATEDRRLCFGCFIRRFPNHFSSSPSPPPSPPTARPTTPGYPYGFGPGGHYAIGGFYAGDTPYLDNMAQLRVHAKNQTFP
ncbi:unnamed protein product [Rotaria magnacalcarata]|uniref:Uncharacterized protein n=1 Tax=Rotaria magnacalcarata TaxID=392030 RepID=A0A816SRT9_9BILA|nr:unnamed protein product [Rotaria magnacalcarata]CAF4219462.1 unnamed protein product [Rotaria magnacalcarata]